jgi:hypothetical protein
MQRIMRMARSGDAAEGVQAFLTEKPSRLARLMGEMTESQRDSYRLVAMDELRESLEKSADTRRDLTQMLIGRSSASDAVSAQRRRMRLLFDSDADMADFLRDALDERAAARTEQFILGGSPTARIQADQADLGATAAPELSSFNPTQWTIEALRTRIGNALSNMTEETVDNLSPLMTMPVSESGPRILRDLDLYGQRLNARRALIGRAGAANVGAVVGSANREPEPR